MMNALKFMYYACYFMIAVCIFCAYMALAEGHYLLMVLFIVNTISYIFSALNSKHAINHENEMQENFERRKKMIDKLIDDSDVRQRMLNDIILDSNKNYSQDYK